MDPDTMAWLDVRLCELSLAGSNFAESLDALYIHCDAVPANGISVKLEELAADLNVIVDDLAYIREKLAREHLLNDEE